MKHTHILSSVILAASLVASASAAVLHTSPFISPGNVINNVTFASVDVNNHVYIEDGVKVQSGGFGYQDGYAPEYYFQGTGVVDKITLVGGGQFGDVDFRLGTGYYAGSYASYALMLGATVVQTGSFGYLPGYGTGPGGSFNPQFFGFSGGGFDAILINDNPFGPGNVNDGGYAAIELASFRNARASNTPDAANTLGLLGATLMALAAFRARRA